MLLLAQGLFSATASAKTISVDSIVAEDLSFYTQQLQNPAVQKLLQTIRYAEGTAGPAGYQTKFGGGKFSDLSRHPDQPVSSGGYTSTAAGAYQFLTPTWKAVSQKLGLKDFSPRSQDIAALDLAYQRLKPLGGFAALEKQGLSGSVAAALSPEWASFPTQSGKSYYGQPVKSLAELQKQYDSAPVGSGTQPQPQPQTVATKSGNTYNIYLTGEGGQQDGNLQFLKQFLPRIPGFSSSPSGLKNLADVLYATPNYLGDDYQPVMNVMQ